MSDQTPITFHNVAACFTEQQWMLLENWQKELYQNVMQEIHEALITLGYTISNTDILFKIKKKDKSCIQIKHNSAEKEDTVIGDLPDILIRIKEEPADAIPCNEESPNLKDGHHATQPYTSYNVITTDVPLNTSEEQESQSEAARLNSETQLNVINLPDNNSANTFCFQTNDDIYALDHYNFVGLENYISHAAGTVVINQEEADLTNYDNYLQRRGIIKHHSKLDPIFDQHEEAELINNHLEEREFEDHYNTNMHFKENNKAQKYRNDFPEMQFKIIEWSEPSTGRTFICSECGKYFLCRSSLSRHRKVHQRVLPYKCIECDLSFPGINCLVLHQRRIHTGERPYICKYCQKSYINQSTLNKHIKSHTGERRYICNVCGKSYGHNYHLVRHQRVHTGERPYQCTLCDKRFYRKATLDKHQIVHMRQKRCINTVLV